MNSKYLKYSSLLVALTGLLACGSPQPAETPTAAEVLMDQLRSLQGKALLFGHQDDLAYGIGWQYEEGQSDVKRTAGDYPALFGWELGGLELGRAKNLDRVPFDKMRSFAQWVHAQGGVNTFSWHPYSPVDTSKNSWVVDERVVEHLLPGGSHHTHFLAQVDQLAHFFKSLTTPEGGTLPFIFRPWHEMDGGWFWWGATLTEPEELQALFRLTIDRLHEQGVDNFLVAYSPDRNFSTEAEYLSWYPGDDYVDIVGVDNYWDLNQGAEGLSAAIQKLEIAVQYAQKTDKVAALTETGLDRIEQADWYSANLAGVLEASELTRQAVYVMLWRNHDLSHFYVPHPEHEAADDFRHFVGGERYLLLSDWQQFKNKN